MLSKIQRTRPTNCIIYSKKVKNDQFSLCHDHFLPFQDHFPPFLAVFINTFYYFSVKNDGISRSCSSFSLTRLIFYVANKILCKVTRPCDVMNGSVCTVSRALNVMEFGEGLLLVFLHDFGEVVGVRVAATMGNGHTTAGQYIANSFDLFNANSIVFRLS